MFDFFVDIVEQIAGSVVQSVMQYIAPLFGFGNFPGSLSANGNDLVLPLTETATGGLGSLLSGDMTGQGIFQQAVAKKTTTGYDRIAAWFNTLGNLGKHIAGVMKDGQTVVSPILNGLSWLLGGSSTGTTSTTNGGSFFGDVIDGIGGAISKGWDLVTSWF